MWDSVPWLLTLLDEGYDKESWHGPNLHGSILRVNADMAAWRPAPDARNIWEITLHAAYWKHTVLRRLIPEKRNSFPRKGSNWYTRPSNDSSESWTEDVKLLDEIHGRLRAAVESLAPSDLEFARGHGKITNAEIIRGIALHDVYHAGQIQTIRQLYSAG